MACPFRERASSGRRTGGPSAPSWGVEGAARGHRVGGRSEQREAPWAAHAEAADGGVEEPLAGAGLPHAAGLQVGAGEPGVHDDAAGRQLGRAEPPVQLQGDVEVGHLGLPVGPPEGRSAR